MPETYILIVLVDFDNAENKPEFRRSPVLIEVFVEVRSAAGLVTGAGVGTALTEVPRALVVLLLRSAGRCTIDGVADSLLRARQLPSAKLCWPE